MVCTACCGDAVCNGGTCDDVLGKQIREAFKVVLSDNGLIVQMHRVAYCTRFKTDACIFSVEIIPLSSSKRKACRGIKLLI